MWEMVQMKMHTLIGYFTEMKNYLDLSGLLLYITFAILYLYDDEIRNYLFIPSLFMTCSRGAVTFFNLFEPTRYLAQMTIATLSDLIPFLVILFG